ncbi:hypothetical protein BDZ97DRAFT_1653154 [Flammula alnicola]|nr:hypothetical protein BDZ97DRAFT_1653154 [Flammula alnicola]
MALNRRLTSTATWRCALYNTQATRYPPGFRFWPTYFSNAEQQILLAASLHKLDSTETRQTRRRRKEFWKSKLNPASPRNFNSVSDLFAPDDMYEFQKASPTFKGHFDGVIHDFREMHLSSWPLEDFPSLEPVLERLHSLCPESNSKVQTHLLHLASYGEILPHVDNLDASGSWILGVSLGDERLLRLKEKEGYGEGREFSLKLPSGSVYLQRDYVRYNYLHSIERNAFDDTLIQAGQRLSIMIRVRTKSCDVASVI